MDNQHRQISGYRELTQDEIDLMNEIKAEGPRLQALCEKVDAYVKSQMATVSQAESDRLNAAFAWKSHGRLHLQQGLMALTRAVAQPTFF